MSESHSPEEIKKSVRTYMMVFGALLVLTIVTVAVSYMHVGVVLGILIALFIACVKGSLVGGFFMHLTNEKRAIYWALLLTAVFFAALMLLPVGSARNVVPATISAAILIGLIGFFLVKIVKRLEKE